MVYLPLAALFSFEAHEFLGINGTDRKRKSMGLSNRFLADSGMLGT
jgi:hypothetical protein